MRGFDNGRSNDDDVVGNERKGWLETNDNIQAHQNIHPQLPDLNPGPIVSSMKYKLDLIPEFMA